MMTISTMARAATAPSRTSILCRCRLLLFIEIPPFVQVNCLSDRLHAFYALSITHFFPLGKPNPGKLRIPTEKPFDTVRQSAFCLARGRGSWYDRENIHLTYKTGGRACATSVWCSTMTILWSTAPQRSITPASANFSRRFARRQSIIRWRTISAGTLRPGSFPFL